jgi:hypothetical protein
LLEFDVPFLGKPAELDEEVARQLILVRADFLPNWILPKLFWFGMAM